MNSSRTMEPGGRFVFCICLRNPFDTKVKDYAILEHLLEKTVASLLKQTYHDVHVVVTCNRTPRWAQAYAGKLHILNVAGNSVFLPDSDKTLDKSFRWIIGSLYALDQLGARYVMLMDADDYVNVHLAEHLMSMEDATDDFDFYMLTRGVHVPLAVEPNYRVHYGSAYAVDEFDISCGSCRVFKADRLRLHLEQIDDQISTLFQPWPRVPGSAEVLVPPGPIERLNRLSMGPIREQNGLLRVLGMHVEQHRCFRYRQLDLLLAAAKGCGHGNHQGHRGGDVHWERTHGRLSSRRFTQLFGLQTQDIAPPSASRFLDDGRFLVSYVRRACRYLGRRGKKYYYDSWCTSNRARRPKTRS